jgi:hypothetical protein
MNIGLGLALIEVIVERELPTNGHHRDFHWERERFSGSDSRVAFPPTLRQNQHVVINYYALSKMTMHAGLISMLIPDVVEYKPPLPAIVDFSSDLRAEFGISQDVCLLLWPTRMVPRKKVRLSLELACRMDSNCVVLISHRSGDEGKTYESNLRSFANLLNV